MGLLRRGGGYDRNRILNEAALAASKRWRRRKAISLYWRVLAVEPGNPDVLAKIAPLLADTGQVFDAFESYRRAAQAYVRNSRIERAVAAYRDAAKRLPRDVRLWTELARIQRHARANREAVQTLLDGRRRFRGRGSRPEAVHLLRCALEIDPHHIEASLDLAWLLVRQDRKHEALQLLERVGARAGARRLHRVRATQFRIEPSFPALWRWLRTRLGAAPEREPAYFPFPRS